MIGLKKSDIQGKEITKRVKFDKFRLFTREANGLTGVKGYNCDCQDGRLRWGIGSAPYSLDGQTLTVDLGESSVVAVYDVILQSGNHTFFFVADDGYLYTRNTAGEGVKRAEIGEYPSCHLIRDQYKRVYCLFAGSSAAYCTVNGTIYTLAGSGNLLGACAAGKRFFLLHEEGVVAFSAPYQPSKWDGNSQEGGEFFIPSSGGKARAIAGYGNALYVFAARAVYRVKVKARASDFVVERLAYDGGEILPRAAVATGTGVCFLAESGLYYVEGDRVERGCAHLPILPKSTESARVAYCDNLAMFEYLSVEEEWTRLVTYPDGKNAFFCGRYGQLGGSEYFYTSGVQRYVRPPNLGRELPAATFETGEETLGYEGQKSLKRLILRGRGEVAVRVISGSVSHRYSVKMEKGVGEARLCERGRAFAFNLIPTFDCEVESMTLEYSRLKD